MLDGTKLPETPVLDDRMHGTAGIEDHVAKSMADRAKQIALGNLPEQPRN